MRAALVASCLRGALPPVDLRAVCLVRACAEGSERWVVGSERGEVVRGGGAAVVASNECREAGAQSATEGTDGRPEPRERGG